MRRLTTGMAAAGVAALLAMGAAAAADGGVTPRPVQYDGPMMGGPGDGMPPDAGPGMGAGPFMGPGGGPPRMNPGSDDRRRTGPFVTYHGFRIDLAEAQGNIDTRSALGEVEHQIDIVDRSGLDPTQLAVFRGVPIRIAVSFAGGGSHYSGGSEVSLGSLQPNDDRPVLLHEYMHVLEFRTFPGRFRNATVRRYFEDAQARGLYPAESYMMSSPPEFFAVTASCYLNGTVARDPYTRAAIRQRQPDYYAYLERLFGPRGDTAEASPRPAVTMR